MHLGHRKSVWLRFSEYISILDKSSSSGKRDAGGERQRGREGEHLSVIAESSGLFDIFLVLDVFSSTSSSLFQIIPSQTVCHLY
jgi:hypothetical protein